jgi:hypothetical protein
MRGIAGREKRYVEVISDTSEDGVVTPLVVVWEDGRRFTIDRVLDRRQAHSLKTGGTGMRYTVSVSGQPTYLWYEGPRWFVEAKAAAMPS